MGKVCLTTYVFGDTYQEYIPLLIYTCKKAYPEYDIKIFLHSALRDDLRGLINSFGFDNVEIIEHKYSDCPNISPLKAKSLRWVLWDDSFNTYDYIYIVDIDMVYIREPIPLHIQHLQHMETTGLCYDNLRRNIVHKRFSARSILRRIKYAGFHSFGKFILSGSHETRATGLHFIATKQYYKHITLDRIEHYRKMIYDNSFFSMFNYLSDEIFLHGILKNEGLTPEKLAIQTNPIAMLDFNDTHRAEFRPHHGIHLGIFRPEFEEILNHSSSRLILDSETYKYYIQQYKQDLLTDNQFIALLSNSSPMIKSYFTKLHKYYNISIECV